MGLEDFITEHEVGAAVGRLRQAFSSAAAAPEDRRYEASGAVQAAMQDAQRLMSRIDRAINLCRADLSELGRASSEVRQASQYFVNGASYVQNDISKLQGYASRLADAMQQARSGAGGPPPVHSGGGGYPAGAGGYAGGPGYVGYSGTMGYQGHGSMGGGYGTSMPMGQGGGTGYTSGPSLDALLESAPGGGSSFGFSPMDSPGQIPTSSQPDYGNHYGLGMSSRETWSVSLGTSNGVLEARLGSGPASEGNGGNWLGKITSPSPDAYSVPTADNYRLGDIFGQKAATDNGSGTILSSSVRSTYVFAERTAKALGNVTLKIGRYIGRPQNYGLTGKYERL